MKDMREWIDLGLVDANPYQPRMVEDAERVANIARSIAANTLLHPPVGRLTPGEGKRRVQLAVGHTRLAAFRYLASGAVEGAEPEQYRQIPVDIRELTDEQMFQLAITENVQRNDLTAIEVARAMLRYRDDFGKTSVEIGELFGLADSAVRNKIRLLDLPAEDQAALALGKMSEGAGRNLLALYALPEHVLVKAEGYHNPDVKPSMIARAAREGGLAAAVDSGYAMILRQFGKELSSARWKWEQPFEGEGVYHPDCKTCPACVVQGNKSWCTVQACFEAKESLHLAVMLEAATQQCGIQPLEEGTRYDETSQFRNYGGTVEKAKKVAMKAGCPNLRLYYDQWASTQVIDFEEFPGVVITCGKRSGHCTCQKAAAAGIKLTPTSPPAPLRPAERGESRDGEGGQPAGISEADLKRVRAEMSASVKAARAQTKELRATAEEQLAAALAAGNLGVWREVARSIHHSVGNRELESLYDFYSRVAGYLIGDIANYNADDVEKTVKNLDSQFKKCGLPAPAWGTSVSMETVEE